MKKTPWELLGLPPGASLEELRRAFRRLAWEQHPDRRPDDAAAEERFKVLVEAFAAAGAERRGRGRPAERRGGSVRERRGEGPDVSASFALSLGEALRGGPHRLRLTASLPCPSCRGRRPRTSTCPTCGGRGTSAVVRSVRVVVPAESRDGDLLRLSEEGGAGSAGHRGDLLVRLAVRMPIGARLDGDDLHLELPLSVGEAWTGARLDVPTLAGPVVVTLPPSLDPRTPFRLRGRGLARRGADEGSRGDLVLHPLVVPPDRRDSVAAAAVGRLAALYSVPLRADFDRLLD